MPASVIKYIKTDKDNRNMFCSISKESPAVNIKDNNMEVKAFILL